MSRLNASARESVQPVRMMMTRRRFAASLPLSMSAALGACTAPAAQDGYAAAVARTWRLGPTSGLAGAALARELVRCATLAPSSHNTQCWKFAIDDRASAITILPDRTRRCPAVDPDDHHLFVSLGCAAENLAHAALAFGLHAQVHFDPARQAVHIALAPTPARSTPLFHALAQRQSTRGLYDGRPLAADEARILAEAGRSERVNLLLLTDRPSIETVLDFVVQGNNAQVGDPAFVEELMSWIRFNDDEALRHADGLCARSSGSPPLPSWIAPWVFGRVFTAEAENDKVAKRLRSAAGVAVFSAQAADEAHWVDVGRAFERFALQATALGIRHAHLNQPVEVASVRPRFARAMGLREARPDLVIRFGRGPALPPSLRRPLESVLV